MNDQIEQAIERIESRFDPHFGIDGATDSRELAKDCRTLIAAARANRPADKHTALLVKQLEQIRHSIQQARIPGNDWRRELALIENTVELALAPKGEPE